MPDTLNRLKTILGEVSDLHRAGAVLDWDQETYMPHGGVQNRSEQLSTLSEVRLLPTSIGREVCTPSCACPDGDEATVERTHRKRSSKRSGY